jgi:acetyl esterase/lipase
MSDYLDRLDPAFREMIEFEGPTLFDALKQDVAAARGASANFMALMASARPPFQGRKDEYRIAGLEDDPQVPVVEFFAEDVLHDDCIIIWLHGGGYLIGSADDTVAKDLSKLAPVVSVEYRMAPEHRSPAAARDVCAVIEHIAASRKPRKIVLAGASAGAGLAASAALMNRDRAEPEVAFQLLIYPMLDDQHDTVSGHMDIPPTAWTREVSLYAWSLYAEENGASQYAAATRATDHSRLPPAYIMCGDLDLFRDEDIEYASKLRTCGVPVEFAIFPGAPMDLIFLRRKLKLANAQLPLSDWHWNMHLLEQSIL